jgi:hypothetical protein
MATNDPVEKLAAAVQHIADDGINTRLEAADTRPPPNRGPMPLWIAIRNRRMDYQGYARFIDQAFCATPIPVTAAAAAGAGGGAGTGAQPIAPPPPPPIANDLAEVMKVIREDGKQIVDTRACLKLGWLGHGLNAYELLKTATEIFLLLECGVHISGYRDLPNGEIVIPGAEPTRIDGTWTLDELQSFLTGYLGGPRLPYIQRVISQTFGQSAKLTSSPFCEGILKPRADCPCFLELIWSYWHEEGMLVQALNAISLRFQNRRIGDGRDPLSQLELSPLRPLSPIFWGYVQDEQHRLSLQRRNYEYEHEYGISLRGKAIPATFRAADRRSKFIEAFHDLLFRCAVYYQQSANLQFNPDPFPLLNGLKDVHLILSQGAGNQFGDLPWTARVEMLMQQWILARPEIREFLGRRPMVSYPEDWMANADALKTMMGWSDTSITHFRNLAVFGEQILLAIRWYDWGNENDSAIARDWASYFRPEIQGYIHAYRTATGVDLSADAKDTLTTEQRSQTPSLLLERKLDVQRRERV